MSKSLADLRASGAVKTQERVYHVCLAGGLIGELNRLLTRADELNGERAALAEADNGPKRLGQRSPRVEEIDAELTRLDELRARLRPQIEDESGDLTLRAIAAGEWRRFVNAHPARTVEHDDAPATTNVRDLRYGYGLVDVDALFDRLGDFVARWNDEELGRQDWEALFAPNLAPGDINLITQMVIDMHEVARDIPKLLSASLST